MKLKFSGNNLNVSLTNAKGEPIYTYQADALNVELDVAKLVDSIGEIQQAISAAMEKAFTEPTPPMILGYQFIRDDGFPVSNAQPTLEEAEEVARFDEVGRFYSVEQTEHGQTLLRYHYSKGMA